MINQRAKEISLPMSSKSLMHDLWIALKVSHYGFVDFIDEPTVLYRQHGNNVIGAKRTNIKYYYFRLAQLPGVMRDNIKLNQMINSLGFRINHFKRLLLKMKIVTEKTISCMKVTICISTFNGQLFFDEQIESILNQTYRNFDILIRDDGSTDFDFIEKLKDTKNNINR